MPRKYRLRCSLVGLFFLCSSALASVSSVAMIKDLRVVRHAHHWQLIFDATKPLHYRYTHLHHPERAIFDISHARLGRPILPSTIVDTPVTNIRTSQHKGQLRLVIELDHSIHIKHFMLPKQGSYSDRLLVDLMGHKLTVVGFGPGKTKKAHHIKAVKTHYKLQPILTAKAPTHINRSSDVVVVIDPGHGGKDPGATGIHGTHEKNVVLKISKDIQHDINQVPGFRAVLTRNSDHFIPLRGRLAIARKYKADMFIAIHADAYINHSAHGVSVFALSQHGATSEAARWLAKRENASELMGGVNLNDQNHLLKSVLLNLAQTATVRTSLQIGSDLVRNIGKYEALHHGKHVEQAAFVVLKSPDIPSLLVETGFITNRGDEHRLTSVHYRHRLAQSISNGICDYFKHRPPRGTMLAEKQTSTKD